MFNLIWDNCAYCGACCQSAREDFKMNKSLGRLGVCLAHRGARAHIKFVDLK